ncbi:MAG: glycosyltransferase [bacterium]|nr:glycosyltransferase [bacterium]
MNCPKVSILIPTYNRAHFLTICLDSVLAQDYQNIEVIVSDNNSNDNTSDIIKNYLSDPRMRYYRNETNVGVVQNWKKLLYEYATGDYGKLLCDDDYLFDKQHIKKGIDLILKENLDIVISGSALEKEELGGQITELVYDPAIPEVTDTIWWLENWGRKIGQHHLFLNFANGAIFNTKKAKELEIFVPGVYGLDYEALFRFMLAGRIGYLQGHQFTGRYHASNAGTSDNFEEAMKGVQIFERIYERGTALGLPIDKLRSFKQRNLVVFVNTFLVPKWFREKGVNLKAIKEFRDVLNAIDPTIFSKVLTSYPTLCWLFRLKNEKLYTALKNMLKANKKSV